MPQLHTLTISTHELRDKPDTSVSPPPEHLHIMENREPEPGYYRFLYQSVGKDVGWVDRLQMSEARLSELLHVPTNQLQVLYVNGNPCGLAELNFLPNHEVHISHFGLIPSYRGKKLGKFFFNWILHYCWSEPVQKTWIRNTNWDHPASRPILNQSGFVKTREDIVQKLMPDDIVPPVWGKA